MLYIAVLTLSSGEITSPIPIHAETDAIAKAEAQEFVGHGATIHLTSGRGRSWAYCGYMWSDDIEVSHG